MDISGYSPEKYDFYPARLLSRSDISLFRTPFVLGTPAYLYSIFEPQNQDERNKATSLLAGILVANVVVGWYSVAGGLTYYGVSTLASIAVGVCIWVAVVVFVGLLLYVTLDAILE